MKEIFIKIMIKNRLDLIIKEFGLSGRQFEKECGLPTGSYSSVSDGLGANKLKQILIKYPQVSARWLVTGEGVMLKNSDKNTSPNTDNRLWTLIESQQRQLESQQRTIEALTKKGDAGGATAVAR